MSNPLILTSDSLTSDTVKGHCQNVKGDHGPRPLTTPPIYRGVVGGGGLTVGPLTVEAMARTKEVRS